MEMQVIHQEAVDYDAHKVIAEQASDLAEIVKQALVPRMSQADPLAERQRLADVVRFVVEDMQASGPQEFLEVISALEKTGSPSQGQLGFIDRLYYSAQKSRAMRAEREALGVIS